ncbi:MAG: divalent-cation tolerance protein CutA [Gammaproteobacteria bacterium]|jgi:periplasmic divalent cation tolerance protein
MQTPKPDQNPQHCIVLSTCPSQEVAESIAAKLVENKLAACVNIVPGLTSVYEWQGKVETDREHLLIAKTVSSAYQAVENTILDSHPYELPEIVSIPINNGLANYLSWIDDCIAPLH